jgi:lysophospholipase L1-like esterase
MRSSRGGNDRSKPDRVPSTALVCALAAIALAGCGGKSNGAPSGTGGTGGAGATDAGAAGVDAGGAGAAGADAGRDAAVTPTTTLYLVGDSTVAAFNDPYYYPRYGYGTQIGKYLDARLAVNNLALSGRSSKSFIDPLDNGNYALFTSSLKAGDYVLIGFGHNDEKADPTLYTNPNTDLTDPTSFQYYLDTYYLKVAQAAGAIPILTTPVVRRDSSGAYTGAKVHLTTDVVSGGVTYPGGDYPQAIRDLGAATGVTVIDNTASTLALGKQIFAASGAAGTAQLQAWVSNLVTSVDDTHTNIYGGAYYA